MTIVTPVTHLVVGGIGEVGSALVKLLNADWVDIASESIRQGQPTVMHIAIPYGRRFVDVVSAYRQRFAPAHVVVHSTVPVGTCAPRGWIHSPVRGVHPHILDGLRTFEKFFGGYGAHTVANYWPGPARAIPFANTCEALKLWDTTQYGVHIRLMQEIHRWCAENDVPFEFVYRYANQTYNVGYETLGRPDVVRPALEYRGPDIGGHCVLQNAELLGGPVAALVREGFK